MIEHSPKILAHEETATTGKTVTRTGRESSLFPNLDEVTIVKSYLTRVQEVKRY